MKRVKALLSAMLALALAGCAAAPAESPASQAVAPAWESLAETGEVPLEYADEFSVRQFEGGYTQLTIGDSEYLLCPRGESVPSGLPEDIAVIETPIENAYLAATSAMDFFVSLEGLGSIAYSGTNAEGWYIPEAKEALQSGQIAFAGKYSAPDYAQLLQGGCGATIESTMILHSHEVKE